VKRIDSGIITEVYCQSMMIPQLISDYELNGSQLEQDIAKMKIIANSHGRL